MSLRKIIPCIALFFLTGSATVQAQQVVEIPHINSGISVDGNTDNVWNTLEEHPISFLIDGDDYPTISDCSGYFKAFWNSDTLYVLIFAEDNKLFTGDRTVYLNDGFEIYLNVDHTKDTVYTENCYQYRFIPGSTNISGRWGIDVWTPPTVDFAIQVDSDTNRTIEAVFPLTALGKDTPVAEGDSMGFEIEILDNDGTGRDHVLSWNKNEHRAWFDPTKMGTIFFTENTITSVRNNESSIVSVYPNPVAGNVSIHSAQQVDEVLIYSVQGQLMYNLAGLSSSTVSLDINILEAGIYIMHIRLSDSTLINRKLIKR